MCGVCVAGLPEPSDVWQRVPAGSAFQLMLGASHVGLDVHRGQLLQNSGLHCEGDMKRDNRLDGHHPQPALPTVESHNVFIMRGDSHDG